MTDLDIVEALKKGQTHIMKELYTHFPSIRSHITSNRGKEEDAEDIFQEALMIFYKNVLKSEFELRSQIKTYLFGIAKNLWLKKLRDDKVHFMASDADDNMLADLDYEFEATTIDEAIEQLVELVDNMEEPCKTILISYYFKKMNMKGIAELLQYKTEQVARQQKYRCIQSLKQVAVDQRIFND